MQVRIDALPGQTAPDDTFVALRVGDVQKQSRLAASRTHRFPEPRDGRGRFGRIEVFQRVGHVTMKFGKPQEFRVVEVPCKFAGDGGAGVRPPPKRLELNVAFMGGSDLTADGKSKARERMDLAQEYLEQHHLEEAIADAMREVVHLKPKDPHSFLSSYILRRASDSDVVAAPSQGGGVTLPHIANKVKKAPGKDSAAGSSESPAPGSDKAGPPALKPTDPRLQPTFEPTLARPASRGELRKLPPLDREAKPVLALPSQQASSRPPAPHGSAAVTAAVAVAPAAKTSSAAPSKAAPRPSEPVVPAHFRNYYRSSFRSCDGAFFSGLHALFSQKTRRSACIPAAEEATESLPLKHLPSVGTWLGRLPLKQPVGGQETSGDHASLETSRYPTLGLDAVVNSDIEKPWYYEPYRGEDAEIVEQIQEVIAQKDQELENLKAQIRLLALSKGVALTPLLSPNASPRGTCNAELLAPPPRRQFLQTALHAQMPPTALLSPPPAAVATNAALANVDVSHGPAPRNFRNYCTANILGMIKKTNGWHAKLKSLPRQAIPRPLVAALRAEVARKDEEIRALRSQLRA